MVGLLLIGVGLVLLGKTIGMVPTRKSTAERWPDQYGTKEQRKKGIKK